MPGEQHQQTITAQLFTHSPDFAKLQQALDSSEPSSLSTLKFHKELMPIILAVACGQYLFRSPHYAAGVHPEAFKKFLSRADIILQIAYHNDPFPIAFANASSEVAKCFFEHYLTLAVTRPDMVLRSIVTAIYAVKKRSNSDDKTEILNYLDSQRNLIIHEQQLNVFLNMSIAELKQHDAIKNALDLDRAPDQICADNIINELGGIPKAPAEMKAKPANGAQALLLYLQALHSNNKSVLEEIAHRFKDSQGANIYDDIIYLIETQQKSRTPAWSNEPQYYLLEYFPKQRACLLRNIREKESQKPLLLYAVEKGLWSQTNPAGIRKNNLDELLKIMKEDMTTLDNPHDPLMTACREGKVEMFVYFFEKYIGYRNVYRMHPTDMHGKEFILNDYLKMAIQEVAQNPNHNNHGEMITYLQQQNEIVILLGSTECITVPDYLKQTTTTTNQTALKN